MSIYRHKQGARLAEAVVTNGLIFLAGQVPENTGADAKAQTENVLGQIDALLAELDRPAILFAAGGETLRGLCEALGAERLDAVGEVAPGVPRSILRGGRWDGVTVVSKSGAFGGPGLLIDIFADNAATLAGAAA